MFVDASNVLLLNIDVGVENEQDLASLTDSPDKWDVAVRSSDCGALAMDREPWITSVGTRFVVVDWDWDIGVSVIVVWKEIRKFSLKGSTLSEQLLYGKPIRLITVTNVRR